MTVRYPFTEIDMDKAAAEWSCNCGPAALAFALQIPLEEVRGTIPDFEAKGYTSPTMMKQALAKHRRTYFAAVADIDNMFASQIALTRIQFTGPWTAPGANPKWAYRQTHWIASWLAGVSMVFDCNGGVSSFQRWTLDIVPLLTGGIKRADGGWFPTHVWRMQA